MKYTRAIAFILTIFICLIISGCTFNNAVAGGSSKGALNIDLEKSLADDRNEFLEISWFSPVSKAVKALDIDRDDIIILKSDDDTFEFATPVFIKPFNRKAKMIMRYSLEKELNEGDGALIEISFDMFADDEADYRELIKQFAQLADRSDLPYLIEDDDIENAVDNRRSVRSVSTNECFYVAIDRECTQNFHIIAGDLAPSIDIAQAFDESIAVRVSMWISVYPYNK